MCPAGALDEVDYPEGLTDKAACTAHHIDLAHRHIAPCGICIKVCPVGEDRTVFGRKKASFYTDRERYEPYHRAWEHVRSYGGK